MRIHSHAQAALKAGLEKLEEYTHPDPYCVNYMPGGTSFMRNAPVQLSVIYPKDLYPEGPPADIANDYQPVHVDMIPLQWRPDEEEPHIIDLYRKEVY
jgi:hypothetical protein